jgi:uncharacterized protein YecE (DUF72 family)
VLYASGYSDAALDRWAARIRAWSAGRDVYCYFDNDAKVKAPFDAARLMERLGLGSAPPPPRRRSVAGAARAAHASP